MVDIRRLKRLAVRRAGSSPATRTKVNGCREALVTSADCKSVALRHTGFDSLDTHQS